MMKFYQKYKSGNSLFVSPILLLFTVLTITIFSGCKKELGEHLLGDLKNQNPYNGTETLIFSSNSDTDSIVFFGKGRNSYKIQTRPHTSNDQYYVNEMDTCCFIEQNGDYKFSIVLASRYAEGGALDIGFGNNKCISHISSRGIPLFVNSPYIDSLFVYDKYYYKVIMDKSLLHQNQGDYNCYDGVLPYSIYYTTTHGIIKIEFEDGTSWDLKKIIP